MTDSPDLVPAATAGWNYTRNAREKQREARVKQELEWACDAAGGLAHRVLGPAAGHLSDPSRWRFWDDEGNPYDSNYSISVTAHIDTKNGTVRFVATRSHIFDGPTSHYLRVVGQGDSSEGQL